MRKTKALGQHFLTSLSILEKIVGVISPQKDELIVEIGAGRGALTFPLADRSARVIAIEKDAALIPALRARRRRNLIVLEQDVLRLDFRELMSKEKKFADRTKLVGNLPYSISSPLLFRILEAKDLFPVCVFLVQREVAERITAGPGTKKFAPLSILFQMDYDVRLCFSVAPGAFRPPPRVQSALLSFIRREKPLFAVKDGALFRTFLRKAFAARRKTLFNNIKGLHYPPPLIQEAMERLSLPGNVRAEQVSIGDFVRLFDSLVVPPG